MSPKTGTRCYLYCAVVAQQAAHDEGIATGDEDVRFNPADIEDVHAGSTRPPTVLVIKLTTPETSGTTFRLILC